MRLHAARRRAAASELPDVWRNRFATGPTWAALSTSWWMSRAWPASPTSLDAALDDVRSNGGVVTARTFSFEGFTRHDVLDPDENVIQLRCGTRGRHTTASGKNPDQAADQQPRNGAQHHREGGPRKIRRSHRRGLSGGPEKGQLLWAIGSRHRSDLLGRDLR